MLPLAGGFLRGKPELLGMIPDGDAPGFGAPGKAASPNPTAADSMTRAEAIRTPLSAPRPKSS